jgi:hemerythrin superfamily protein
MIINLYVSCCNVILSTEDQKVKQYAGPRICEALLQHTRLEEAVFYPAVEKLDVAMTTRCLDDHHAVDELIEQMQNLLPGDSDYDELVKHLNDAIHAHMEARRAATLSFSKKIELESSRFGTAYAII